MNSRDIIILKKIIQYSDEIQDTITRYELNFQKLDGDFVFRNAISMCILQIVELVGNLSEEFKLTYNKMPWRDIKAMRNIAAHNYGEFDSEIIWETAINDIPELKNYIKTLL